MKITKTVMLTLILSCAFTSCTKKEGNGGGEFDIVVKEPVVSSETYRRAFNETASELYDIQWIQDRNDVGKLNLNAGEIIIPESQMEMFGLQKGSKAYNSRNLNRALKLIDERLEGKRKEALSDALSEEVEYHSMFDIAALTNPNREAARILIETGYLISDLYKLQNHPDGLVFEKELVERGDPLSIAFFQRMSAPYSIRYGNRIYANAMSTFPDRMVGAIMWPDGMNMDIFASLASMGKAGIKNEYLSPFTVVKRTADNKFFWIPYGHYKPFKDLAGKIAEKLGKAAKVEGLNPGFTKQLALQSESFLSKSAFPFFKSDEAWVSSEGQLELVIGPYEPDRDPYSTKAFYEFILATVNPKATKFLGRLKTIIAEIELGIASTVPDEIYKARDVKTDPRLRVVDVILASGMSSSEDGPHMASILPNIGPYSILDERKTLIMANHHQAKLPILKATADAVLTPYMADLIDADEFIIFTTLRALMHTLGPQEDTITTKGIRSLEALGENFKKIKQAKAGVAASWAAHILAAKGIISQEELKRFYATYLANLFRYMRFGVSTSHGAAAAAEFAYIIYHGGIKETKGGLEIDPNVIQSVLNNYLAKLVRTLATGDEDMANELLYGYVLKSSDLLSEYVGRVRKANIPRDVAVYYHVEGL